MKVCVSCGKKPVVGRSATYRGMLKRAGGVGRKTVRTHLRRFMPNLQRISIKRNGTIKRVLVCTACIKSGRIVKPPSKPSLPKVKA